MALHRRLMTEEEIRRVRALRNAAPLDPQEAVVVECLVLRANGSRMIDACHGDTIARLVNRHWVAVEPLLRPSRFVASERRAIDFIEVWGLRTSGRLQTAKMISPANGRPGIDEAESIAEYVESVPEGGAYGMAFQRAHPALLWRFGRGLEPESMFYRYAGEPLSQALVRLGWFEFRLMPERRIPAAVIDRFVAELTSHMATTPYRSPQEIIDLDVLELADQASDELAGISGRRRRRKSK
ncbi:hypothetical protein [Fimbriimonas ginsengisoli]|uniref:Uncharacterized protein n=1 Tax=Fimbriimonas ginsengisoli Gsoil 348 TaxID=661478 RepID=A0A068NL85_FIMGI|nr:hypothetical protein [Fimbriimonas ginsengisoli]AIE83520.1 hypothetical protein OP10G_0152 [Fimbriimonas ginsengisoli Gsoil 348]